jgi:hypothetical protein
MEGWEVMEEQRHSHHGDQKAEKRGFRKRPVQHVVPKDIPLVTYFL